MTANGNLFDIRLIKPLSLQPGKTNSVSQINANTISNISKHRVVVIGAGFAGIELVKHLKHPNVEVILIDKNNYHQFTPLLYQVALSQLEIEEIVFPIRQICKNRVDVTHLMAEVVDIDRENKLVVTDRGLVEFDQLVIATGSVTNFFGIKNAADYCFELKTLGHGIQLRNHILRLIERGEHLSPKERAKLFSFVIVGGGPTGVEFAGALAELIHGPIIQDHPGINSDEFSIHLVDANPEVLKVFDEKLSKYTMNKLEKMGVTLHPSTYVIEVTPNSAILSDGRRISSHTIVWSAGVAGHDYLKKWGLEVSAKGFVKTNSFLQTHTDPSIFAIGDVADIDNTELPKMATVAVQQGKYLAEIISELVTGTNLQDLVPFSYKDRGKMAVIGRNAAVVELSRLKFTGLLAWLIWSGLHIFKLIGIRNRLNIIINWVLAYIRKGGQTRIILPQPESHKSKSQRMDITPTLM